MLKQSRYFQLIISFLLTMILAACGGGGGGGSDDPGFLGGGDGGGDGTAGTPGIDTVAIALALVRDGSPVTSITTINPAELTITVRDSGGDPLANVVVTGETTLGQLLPASGTALTNTDGLASLTLEAGADLGAGTVTVTVSDVSQTFNFQIGESGIQIGSRVGGAFVEGVLEIASGSTLISPGGSTVVTATVVDGSGVEVTNPVTVSFRSQCSQETPELAQISDSVTTQDGIATATYTANGCEGADNITASVLGAATDATGTVNIAAADVNSIAFLSADPTVIALQGTGGAGRSETSEVEFQVLDESGLPVPNADVEFTLSTRAGGLSLTGEDSNGVVAAVTNATGIARVTVAAGNVATPVRVNASIEADIGGMIQTLTTVSDQLVVSTGLPDQDSTSLAASSLNIAGGQIDGIMSTLTIRMADIFNNPVPDGTVALFTTEFGSIGDSCTTIDGACSVDLESQAPRQQLFNTEFIKRTSDIGLIGVGPELSADCPEHTPRTDNPATTDVDESRGLQGPCPSALGNIFGRRSNILVTSIGEESFVDANANGLYDDGELFEDLPEAFVDHNENGVYDGPGSSCDPATSADCASGFEETFADFNNNGVYDFGNALYNGTLCRQVDADAGICSRELVNVRRNLTVVLSNDDQNFLFIRDDGMLSGIVADDDDTDSGTIYIADIFNNMPASGSTVSITAEGCNLFGTGEDTVPNSNAKGAYAQTIRVQEIPDNDEQINGSITIELTIPDVAITQTVTIECTDPM